MLKTALGWTPTSRRRRDPAVSGRSGLKKRTRITFSVVLALSVLVAVAALAWACVPTARITLSQSSGAPGTQVTVTGTGFNEGLITLRWNDVTTLDTVQATGGNETQGHGFVKVVTIPAAAPGCHTINASNPSPGLPAGAPFEIPGTNCAGNQPPGSGPVTTPTTTPTTGGGFFPTTSDRNCQGKAVTTEGTAGKDSIEGTSGVDVIDALGGNDTVKGLGGNDVICGGAGKDKLVGGKGSDRLSGGAGRDRLLGGPGADRMSGGAGKDKCVGGPGRDKQKSC